MKKITKNKPVDPLPALDPKKPRRFSFEAFATYAARITGSTGAFVIAVFIILAWALTGPIFDYSQTWQLIINTGTTIVTFLMVFLIQKAQNKESVAIQLKLNELVAANELASNRMVSVEDMTEEEMRLLQKFYSRIALMSKKDGSLNKSHSIEEAQALAAKKAKRKRRRTPKQGPPKPLS